MATYTILKKTRQHAVVKVVGTGQVTIPLSDLKLSDETLTTPKAGITYMAWATPSANIECHIIITRAGKIIYDLSGNGDWNFAQNNGFRDDDNSDGDLEINFAGDSGSLIIGLTKSGYQEPETQGT